MPEDNDNEKLEEIMDKIEHVDKLDFQGRKELALIMGFFLHPNLWMHILFSLLINLAVIMGIYFLFHSTNYPFILCDNPLYILALAVLFTAFDYIFKYFMLKFLPKVMMYSFGLVFFFLYFLIFWFLGLIMGNRLDFVDVGAFIFFVFFFGILKLLISICVRRIVTQLMLDRRG